MRIELLIIDPQIDFCWPGIKEMVPNIPDDVLSFLEQTFPELVKPGSLFVPGADKDMNRLAEFIKRVRQKLYDIHVTMDSHHNVDVAHPIFTMNASGQHPDPFTIITDEDVEKGKWVATNPGWRERFATYVKKLHQNGRYPLCVWPPHCLIGSFGYGIYPPLFQEILAWEEARFAIVDKVTKGSNYFTEHYSAVQADVPDDDDPDTQLNESLIRTLEEADMILLAGEARDYCVANTVRDIADNFGEESIKKMYLLTDCTSDVGAVPGMGEDFVKEMVGRGMNLTTSTECLA